MRYNGLLTCTIDLIPSLIVFLLSCGRLNLQHFMNASESKFLVLNVIDLFSTR